MKLEGRKHRVIGVRYPVWCSYGSSALAGIANFMRENEPWRIVTENDNFGELEPPNIDANWQGDGLVLFRATEEELTSFRDRGIAVVLTSTEGPDLGFPRVVPDNAMIGKLAAQHLMGCGVERFAYLGRGEIFYQQQEFAPGLRLYTRERLAGFREELVKYSIEPIAHYLQGRPLWKSHAWRQIQSDVMDFLSQLALPCGLFVADDSLGVAALRAADLLKLEVPKDLVVIGFGNDLAWCHASFPPLSSIPWPGEEIGKTAAAQLQLMMDGGTPVQGRIEISVSGVIPRESSNTLAFSDLEINKLIHHIRSRAPHDPIRVSELRDMSPLSLSTIKTRFNQSLGHGPKQEIQRVRLQHLTRLLEQSSKTLAEISKCMNFTSAHEMSRFFLAATGERPGTYRESTQLGRITSHGKPPCAVVFDMDRTLFDTEELHFESYRLAAKRQGGKLTHENCFNSFLGVTRTTIEQHVSKIIGLGFNKKLFWETRKKEFINLLNELPLTPLPGVWNSLEHLCEAGVALALTSTSDADEIHACLDKSGLSPYFPIRISVDDVSKGNPDSEIYLLACKKLGLSPLQCVAVESSHHGQNSALTAGMRVIRVTENEPEGFTDDVIYLTSLDEYSLADWKFLLGSYYSAKQKK